MHEPPYRSLVLLFAALMLSISSGYAQIYRHYAQPSVSNGSSEVGLLVSYIMPRNDFAVEFDRGPSYELYYQMRSDEGNGRWAARVGLFYADFKPRLDSFPKYMVQTSPAERLIPGYVAYTKFDLKGFFIDYAYSVVKYRRFRLDLGLGLMVGLYQMDYSEAYETVVSVSGASMQEFFAGLRPKLGLGCRLNKYLELFGEYKAGLNTSVDWSMQFPTHSVGLGLNVTINPADPEHDK